MKKFKLWHLALIAIAVFLIFAVIVSAVVINDNSFHTTDRWSINWNNTGWDMGFGIGKEYSIDTYESLNIEGNSKIFISAVAADINIYQSDNDEIEVHLYGDYSSRKGEIKFDVTDSGNTTKIIVKYPKNGGVNRTDLTLDIQIPVDYNKDLTIGGVSSDLVFECDDMMFEEININNVSGQTYTDTLHAQSLTVSTVSGDVSGEFSDGSVKVDGVSSDVNLTGISYSIEVDTVSGDVDLSVVKIDKIVSDSVSGDVTITLEDENDFYVVFDSVSGNFSCDIPLTIIKQKGGDFEGHTGNKNAPEINVDSVSGDLTIIN